MSRVIKVTEKTYMALDKLRTRGETFSDVIDRLLLARTRIMGLIATLALEFEFDAWRQDQLREIAAATVPPAPPAQQ